MKERLSDTDKQEDIRLNVENLNMGIRKMTNWKASGPDCVQGYWFKRFSSLHSRLTKHLQACVAVGDVATWMTKRKTALPICYYHATNEFQSEPTIYNLPECQGTPFSKQGSYLKFK